MAVLLDDCQIDLCGIGLGYTHLALDEADEKLGIACLEAAAARGDEDAAFELDALVANFQEIEMTKIEFTPFRRIDLSHIRCGVPELDLSHYEAYASNLRIAAEGVNGGAKGSHVAG